jgi:multicomponent Na+:H+ antiporter subunit D
MLLALPILLPLATAIALHLLPQRAPLLRAVAFAGALAALVAAASIFVAVQEAGIQVLQIGSWPAPFGITLVADLFSAVMVVMVSVIGVAVTGMSFAGVDPRREALGYHALIHVVLMGVAGAFLTGDIFNLYVWFEVMLIGSFVLMALHRTRAQLHAAFTYVGLNLLASAFLLTAIGLLYGQAGTLNLADLARAWPERRTPGLDAALSMLFLTAFGIKAGLFPLFFWLPASYHTPPAAVGALLAGLLTKVGVYAMVRVFTLLFPDPSARVYSVLLVLSAATMVVGLTGALAQRDLRRVLAFNLVGHIGFTTVGLAAGTPAALGGSILYVLHHMLVISTLFLVSGLFLRQRRTTELAALGGLYRSQPAVACLVMIPVFSLAGVPPLSGFVAKVGVIGPMLASGQYFVAAVALSVSWLTVMSMARLWEEAFWKPAPVAASSSIPQSRVAAAIVWPIAFLVALTIGLTVLAGPASRLTTQAAEQLLDPRAYVGAVLGEEAPRAAR